VLDAAVIYEHSFNAATKLLAGVTVESGGQNTTTNANIALQVKMTDTLALSAGYQLTHNSEPPAGVGTTSTLTTLNLVYQHKNPKLSPE
jgi:putative salt-induced outer membrane protein YdiY